MASEPNTTEMDVEPNRDGKDRIVAADLKVGASGRVTIPEGKRERYGIEQGDFVDLVMYVTPTEEDDA